jgi:WD40 repeat protein
MHLNPQSTRIGLILRVMFAATGIATRSGIAQIESAPDHGTLEIIRATWRVAGEPDVDVTAQVAAMVKDGQLTTKVRAAALGVSAPGNGRAGTLAITYRINGGDPQTRTVRGGGTPVQLSAPVPEVTDTTDHAQVLKGQTGGVHALAFSVDSKTLASGSVDGKIFLWDVATGKLTTTIAGDADVTTVTFSPDGKHLAWGTMDHTIATWSLSQQKSDSAHGQECPVVGLTFLQDSKHFVSGCGENLRVWDIQSAENIGVYPACEWIRSLAVSTSGKVVTMDRLANLIEWDPMTGKKLSHHERPTANTPKGNVVNFPQSVSAGRDDHILVNDMTGIWDWDLSRDTLILVARQLYAMTAVSKDGKYYFGRTSTASLWARQSGSSGNYCSIKLPTTIHDLALSPDGKYLALANGDWLADEKKHDPLNFAIHLEPPFEIRLQTVEWLEAGLTADNSRVKWTTVSPSDPAPIPWK